MTDPHPDRSELYKRLRAEAQNPYRPLRRFIYFAFAGSSLIGGIIFCLQLLAGRGEWNVLLPNLGIQLGGLFLFILLLRWDRDR